MGEASAVVAGSEDMAESPAAVAVKRLRLDDGVDAIAPDLCVSADVVAARAAHRLLLTECHRYAALADLRKSFGRAWKLAWGHAAAAEAFNAWLLEALGGLEPPEWPPLPSPTPKASDGASMFSGAVETWALLQVPCDWPLTDDVTVARRHLERYVAALKAPATPPSWPGLAGENVDSAVESLHLGDCKDPAELRAIALQAFRPLVAAAIAPQVKKFSEEVDALANAVRDRWMERCSRSLSESEAAQSCRLEAMEEPFTVAGGLAKVRLELRGGLPEGLEGKLPKRYEIHLEHSQKLRRLFGRSGPKREAATPIEAHCWALLVRYQALFGPHDEGAGWHMALTPGVMQNLVEDFGVAHELFASPLNCALPDFCSLFPDTDTQFGSHGGFFQFCRGSMTTEGGSFECNPPFEEHLMRRVVAALLDALAICGRPLSVAVVLPDWPDSEAIARLQGARSCRACVRISGGDHAYLNGRQHCCQPRHRVLRHADGRGSLVIFMQNDSGAIEWPATEERLERHRRAWGS
mmetsp:Transcript_79817/g.222207  ORF Transcript_79817/g.222207 Transcript_79817/m.222207 type:complete len:523 (-) Transcript_79817:85-1653(-)